MRRLFPNVAAQSFLSVFLLAAQANAKFEQFDIAALERTAKRGDKIAQLELGDRYRSGEGVRRDPVEAQKWYERAAKDIFLPIYVFS